MTHLRWMAPLRKTTAKRHIFLWVLLASALVRASLTGPIAAHSACDLCIKVAANMSFSRWRMAQFELSVPRLQGNPYDGEAVDLRARLTAPSGRRWLLPAYFDPAAPGGWRLRFMPDEPGRWTAQLELKQPLARRGPSVAFHVQRARPGDHGFVRVHRANPRMLQFDDGAPYFPVGVNVAWYTNAALAEYARRFDAMAANGVTAARVWLTPWSFALEWKDTPLRDFGNRQPRLAWFDAVLDMAQQRNIHLLVVLLEPGMFDPAARWRDNPYNTANNGPCATPVEFLTNTQARAAYRNQLRYIAARWGQSPNILAWEWMNEVNSAPGFETEVLLPWMIEMTAALREFDVRRHLTTISYADIAGDPRVWNSDVIDLVQRHEYSQGDPKWFAPALNAAGQAERFQQLREQPAKPMIVGEFGANNGIERPEGAYREGIHLHNSLWASTFSGFAGTAMYWWWDNYIESGNLWPAYRGLAEFVRGEDLARFEPRRVQAQTSDGQRLVAMALGQGDRVLLWVRNWKYQHELALGRYVVERSSGQTTAETYGYELSAVGPSTLTIPVSRSGRYSIVRLDTQTGAVGTRFWLRADGGRLNIPLETLVRDAAFKIEQD